MKLTWKVLAVCFLLQSVSVFADLPINHESTLRKGKDALNENQEYLFKAIFNATNELVNANVNELEEADTCENNYEARKANIISEFGSTIRKCLHINPFMLESIREFEALNKIKQQYMKSIKRCSSQNFMKFMLNCYSAKIKALSNNFDWESFESPIVDDRCLYSALEHTLKALGRIQDIYDICTLNTANGNSPWAPPQWNSTWVPPQWNSTWAPPQWNYTWSPPQWNTTWAPPQWNSTWAPPQWNTTWVPPQWNSTWATPQWNSTWAPPQWNSTWAPPQWNTTWAPPQWNTTWAPPQWNSTWAPPQWNSTWAPPQWNTTWAPPQWNTTWPPPQWNTTWAPPQWNSTWAPPQWNSTWAPPQLNTTWAPPPRP